MPDAPADPVAATLADARHGFDAALDWRTGPNVGLQQANAERGFALLGALEAVLARHQPGRVMILGSLCREHEAHRHFSITSTEADAVTYCPACMATVYVSCAGCGVPVPLDQCPDRRAISAGLLGKDRADRADAIGSQGAIGSRMRGSSVDPTPDCGGPRKPPGATEMWFCAAHREFHAPPGGEGTNV